MNYYSDSDIADDLQMFADRVGRQIKDLERVDTLPSSRRAKDYLIEIKARQKAAEILSPVRDLFAASAAQHRRQADEEVRAASASPEEAWPTVPMFPFEYGGTD